MAEENNESFKLVGFSNFIRTNPKSDRFKVKKFHHAEFWCSDASNTARRFSWGLGMGMRAKSDLSTGNMTHASYLISSGNLNLLFTAPYSPSISEATNLSPTETAAIPSFNYAACRTFSAAHGLAVRAIAIEVGNAEESFSISVSHGAKPAFPPILLENHVVLAEIYLYGDVVLRYISFKTSNSDSETLFLPKFAKVEETSSSFPLDYGIRALDHAVGNVLELGSIFSYVKSFTGFHEFVEFTTEDVGTSDNGFNTAVLANNDETVLLPINEAVLGTKSQVRTFLEHNEGEGVQHLALLSEDIFRTLKEMRKRSFVGGFEFMPSPPPTYYQNLKHRVEDVLSEEQIEECEELGILVDRDNQGILLQIFTKPVGDRPTIFLEIIQRIGCLTKNEEGELYQKGGCGGGFGKGNVSELFKSIAEYEKTLGTKLTSETGALLECSAVK